MRRMMPGYREALIESRRSALNAAQAAYDLRLEVERAGKWEIEVLYSIYDTRTHRVNMPFDPSTGQPTTDIGLAKAPTNPRDFTNLAVQIAKTLKPGDGPSAERNGPQPTEADFLGLRDHSILEAGEH